MDIEECIGKAINGVDGTTYGLIRNALKPFPNELKNLEVLAEDECGNYFVTIDGQVYFWDHETSEKSLISGSFSEFKSLCFEPEETELNDADVISSWIDPNFAREHGIKQ